MKALRIYGPQDARYEEVPMPSIGPEDVLIKVKAVGICATDLEIYDGTMVFFTSGLTKYPVIPGHEWSGEIVEIGRDVTGFVPGDRVVGEVSLGCRKCKRCLSGRYHLCAHRSETGILGKDGAMAEFLSFPRTYLHKVNDLSFQAAAAIEPTAIAIHPVRTTRISPSDRVAVMGAGPIGLFCVQVAKAYGASQVIVVDGRQERLQVGLQVGADIAVNYQNCDFRQQVAESTGGEMIDVVIEAAGRREVWPLIASIVAPSARIGMVGLFAGATCEVDFDPVVVTEISILGCVSSPGMWPEAISLHRRGVVQAEKIVTHRFPLAKFAEAVAFLREGRNGAIKVMLEP